MGSTDDRVIRLVVGALLSSNLSTRELRAFASALQRDPDCAQRIGVALSGAVSVIEVESPKRSRSKHEITTPEGELAERFCSILERHNVTTSALVELIREVAPSMEWMPGPNWTKRRIVESFLAVAPPQVIGEVMRRVIGDASVLDPYLAGLLKRGGR